MSEIQANVFISLLTEKLDSHQSVSTFKNCLLVRLFRYQVLAYFLLYLSAFYIIAGIFIGWGNCKYTWIYENRVSKKNCNVSHLSLVFACLLSCLLMWVFFVFLFLWLGICVEVAVDRISRISFLTPSLSDLQLKWQLFEISARLKLVSVPFSSLVLYIGHLEKSFPESIM